MEASLLQLDVGAPEPELVNTIFRVAHSIKGGAATFGFGEIASFTHSLETLLDELRAQRMQVTVGLMDLLLKSVDVMRDMLRTQQANKPIDAQRVADLQFDLELAVAQKGAARGARRARTGAGLCDPLQADAAPARARQRSVAHLRRVAAAGRAARQGRDARVAVAAGARPGELPPRLDARARDRGAARGGGRDLRLGRG